MSAIISQATAKGRRPYQEDRSFVKVSEEGLLLAVFDGHSGDEVSQFCRDNIQQAFDAVKENPSLPFLKDKMRAIFNFLNVRTNQFSAGSTASVIFIPPTLDRAVVGILGDSPVIIKNATSDVWISPEHNIRSNPSEVTNARNRGGVIYGGYLYNGSGFDSVGLQMSRALGDKDLSDVLNREPEIFEIPLGIGSFILAATDGLFDPAHQSDKSQKIIVDMIESKKTADDLVKYALSIPTHDNVSAILVRIAK